MNSRGEIMRGAPKQPCATLSRHYSDRWQTAILSCWWRRWWWRCLGLGGRARLGRRRAAADIDHRAVAALHFGIHPAQNQNAAIEQNHFAILRAAGWIFGGSDESSAA